MSLFIKTERFTKETTRLSNKERNQYLIQHKSWVNQLQRLGYNIASGYLVNNQQEPGGGGFLVFEANNFDEAKLLIIEDPMIKNNLVEWELQEWISVSGKLLEVNHN